MTKQQEFTPEDEYYGREFYERTRQGGGNLHWSALPEDQRDAWTEKALLVRAIPAYVAPVDPVVELARRLKVVYDSSGTTDAWLHVARLAIDFCAKPSTAQTEITAPEFKVGDRVVFDYGFAGARSSGTVVTVVNNPGLLVKWDNGVTTTPSPKNLRHAGK
jgi:hypothetical protein